MSSLPQVHLHEHGTGLPILLIPGLSFPAVSWAPVTDGMEDGYHWLAVDLPGHGGSSPWEVVRPEELADRLAAAVARRSASPPLVVGHSYGAAVALLYAARHPVQALVTVDQRLDPDGLPVPPTGLAHGSAEAVAPQLLTAIRSSLHLEALPDVVAAHVAEVHRPVPEMVVPYLRALEGTSTAAFLAPVAAAAARMHVPWVDVHRGDPGAAHRSLVATGGGDVQVWGGGSHCVHLEHHERFRDLVRDLRAPAPRQAAPAGRLDVG